MNNTLKSALLGALGGAAGVFAMRLYWNVATTLRGEDPRLLTDDTPPDTLDEVGLAGQQAREDESSTAALGRLGFEAVTGEAPDDQEKAQLSTGVHWGYGLAMGALYGALRGRAETPDLLGGFAFGTALWILGDEVLVPLLGLSKGPTAHPPAQHAHRFGAHVAYGVAASATTQALQGVTEISPGSVAWKTAKTYAKWRAVKGAGKLAVAGARKVTDAAS